MSNRKQKLIEQDKIYYDREIIQCHFYQFVEIRLRNCFGEVLQYFFCWTITFGASHFEEPLHSREG